LSEQLIEEWWTTGLNHHYLITDRRSTIPNYPEFIENRHDQSVLSLLLKQYSVVAFPASELGRDNFDNIPFQPVRNKIKTTAQTLKGKVLLPMRYAIGLYLKHFRHFDFAGRIAW
jgi:hypothetical protein